jgi:hypothetical protein
MYGMALLTVADIIDEDAMHVDQDDAMQCSCHVDCSLAYTVAAGLLGLHLAIVTAISQCTYVRQGWCAEAEPHNNPRHGQCPCKCNSGNHHIGVCQSRLYLLERYGNLQQTREDKLSLKT